MITPSSRRTGRGTEAVEYIEYIEYTRRSACTGVATGKANMQSNAPDYLNLHWWFLLVVLGMILAVVGWLRYFG